MDDVVKTAWAEAGTNGDFIYVKTCSGYRSFRADPLGVEYYTRPDIADVELGSAVLDALTHSRFVLPQYRADVWQHPDVIFDKELYNRDATADRYREWVSRLQKSYGYKTKRALFKDMKTCDIECKVGGIIVRPRHHEKLELWTGKGISESDCFHVPLESDPSVIGATLRLGFNRCT